MSGGSMDYVYGKIYEASCHVRDLIGKLHSKSTDDFEFDAQRMHMKPSELREKVIAYAMNAYKTLRIAEVYARRVEWLDSGDDGYDTFIKRTDEELKEVERALSSPVEKPTPYSVDDTRECLAQVIEAVERTGYKAFEEVDDDSPMYRAWKRAKAILGATNGQ